MTTYTWVILFGFGIGLMLHFLGWLCHAQDRRAERAAHVAGLKTSCEDASLEASELLHRIDELLGICRLADPPLARQVHQNWLNANELMRRAFLMNATTAEEWAIVAKSFKTASTVLRSIQKTLTGEPDPKTLSPGEFPCKQCGKVLTIGAYPFCPHEQLRTKERS